MSTSLTGNMRVLDGDVWHTNLCNPWPIFIVWMSLTGNIPVLARGIWFTKQCHPGLISYKVLHWSGEDVMWYLLQLGNASEHLQERNIWECSHSPSPIKHVCHGKTTYQNWQISSKFVVECMRRDCPSMCLIHELNIFCVWASSNVLVIINLKHSIH